MRAGSQGGVLSQVRDQVSRRLRCAPTEPRDAGRWIETAAQQLRRPAGRTSQCRFSFYELPNHI
jgi:hypothetical protein